MSYFDNEANVDAYIAMADGFDIVALESYKEMKDGDSLSILLRKTHDR